MEEHPAPDAVDRASAACSHRTDEPAEKTADVPRHLDALGQPRAELVGLGVGDTDLADAEAVQDVQAI
ncbi:hypothetical protein ABZ260_48710, partial [Streptosporangium sp. NPDC006013]|uniref:hypothetical protein n=1 Tax=Streptosporangium sp. NPDC006013 TaxID=3155596 RepID=UPI0033A62F8C